MHLTRPDLALKESFLHAQSEFVAAGEEVHARLPSWPVEGAFPGVDFTAASLVAPGGFAAYVAFLCSQEDPATPRPAAYVSFTELWLREGEHYLGRISLRHELNDGLLNWGGHIGYAVRPTARRRGHATRALSLMLLHAGGRGIDPVLVTCDEGNIASRRTIVRAGGVHEDTRDGKQRFWIPASSAEG